MTAMSPQLAREVLELWFSDRARALWFAKDTAFDDELRSRFGALVEAAASGACDGWMELDGGALALLITLDQFPRNLHRGSPLAFACDGKAREVADRAIARGLDLATPLDRRLFFYLPFQHSESLADQERAVALMSRWAQAHQGPQRGDADEELRYARRHHEIIQRFGRFPHRNAVVGRTSTAAELAFLTEPDSSF